MNNFQFSIFNFQLKIILILCGLIAVLYFVNIKPGLAGFYITQGFRMNKSLQTGFYVQDKVLKYLRQGFSYGAFGRGDNAMSVSNYTSALFDARSRVFADDMKALLELSIQEISKVSTASPEDARYRALQGILYLKLKEYDESAGLKAEKSLYEAVAMAPQKPDILVMLSKAKTALDKQDEATALLEKSVALAPNSSELQFNLAAHYFLIGQVEKARETVRTAIQTAGGHWTRSTAYLNVFLAAYDKYGLYSDSMDLYKDIMLQDPLNYQWPLGLMNVYLKLGQTENAKEMAKKVVKLSPAMEEELAPWL